MEKSSKSLLTTALVCLLVIVCFTCFRIDTSRYGKDVEIKEKTKTPMVKRVSEEGDVIVPTKYTVILEDGRLNFYMIVDTKRVILESVIIAENLYPVDDIKSLKNGIDVENLEAGIGIIEDFTS